MTVETRYFTHDVHTINGLEADWLKTTYTDVAVYALVGYSGTLDTGYWAVDIAILHADGTETSIASKVAQISFNHATYGYLSATYEMAKQDMVSTDCIVVRVYGKIGASGSWVLMHAFSTEQLGAQSLDAATWTVYYNVYIHGVGVNYVYYYYWVEAVNPDYIDLISNFSWTPVAPPPSALKMVGDGLTCVVC